MTSELHKILEFGAQTLNLAAKFFLKTLVMYKHRNNTIRLTIQQKAALTTCVYRK